MFTKHRCSGLGAAPPSGLLSLHNAFSRSAGRRGHGTQSRLCLHWAVTPSCPLPWLPWALLLPSPAQPDTPAHQDLRVKVASAPPIPVSGWAAPRLARMLPHPRLWLDPQRHWTEQVGVGGTQPATPPEAHQGEATLSELDSQVST